MNINFNDITKAAYEWLLTTKTWKCGTDIKNLSCTERIDMCNKIFDDIQEQQCMLNKMDISTAFRHLIIVKTAMLALAMPYIVGIDMNRFINIDTHKEDGEQADEDKDGI